MSTNRMRLAYVRETTPGVTPGSPRMRRARITGESLAYAPEFQSSDELRDDRMNGQPVQIFQSNQGGVNGELSYPVNDTWLSDLYRSAFYATWNNTPERDNDGTADSIITDVIAASQTVNCTTGDSFPLGALVLFSGFGQAANNGVRRVTTAGATAPVFLASGLVNESAPAASARMKTVGFEGASGDITATATGLASTTLNFTTFNLQPGMWIKIGGAIAGQQFNTAALNDWARISGPVTANAIPLDNRPAGWATDSAAGKTIRVFFGDWMRNGVTRTALSIERGFLHQGAPTYIVQRGMTIDQFSITAQSRQKITWTGSFVGHSGAQGTSTLSASPDAATVNAIMGANVNLGRVGENGAAVVGPNFIRSIGVQVRNNLRVIEAADSPSPVGINEGECSVTANISAMFGDNSILTRMFAGLPTSLNFRTARNGQAVIHEVPAAIYTGGGNPSASGKNQDVMQDFEMTAFFDTLTQAHILVNRIPYFE